MQKRLAEANPFAFGDLAQGEDFTDRERELAELLADMGNGQNVLLYAPRRYGKSSLALRAADAARQEGVLVGYVDLMKTPTKERLCAALAKTIHSDLDTRSGDVADRAATLFRGLRVRPVMEIDPEDGSLSFSFRASQKESLDDTLERLLELPAQIARERRRPTVLIFDEFQEVVALDKHLPNMMRAVFQTQPEVAHVYLGSKRHLIDRIFNDRNEPFWRSAKRAELGLIERVRFAQFVKSRFEHSERSIDDDALRRLLEVTQGHPYATQELAYFTWARTPHGFAAHLDDVEQALAQVLRSEHNHFAKLWEDASHNQRLVLLALAQQPTSGLYLADYRERFELPSVGSTPNAVAYLERAELVGRDEDGNLAIVEPFFAEWLKRERLGYGLAGAN